MFPPLPSLLAAVLPLFARLDGFLASVPVDARADSLLSALAAVGAAAYWRTLRRLPERTPLESRARWLVGALALLCGLRAVSWLVPDHVPLALLAFVPATLLPVAMALFAEGLLRRHLPRWLKLVALGVTVVAFLVNLARPLLGPERIAVLLGPAFAGALVFVMALLGVALVRRDVRSLSRAEHGLVRAVFAVTVVSLPLAVTDFRPFIPGVPNRMGGLAVLLLVYTILRPARARTRLATWLRAVLALVARGMVAAALLVALVGVRDGATAVHLLSMATAVVFLIAIVDRLQDLARSQREAAVLGWLAEPLPATLADYARALRRLPLTTDAVLVDESELAAYDVTELRLALAAGDGVVTRAGLERLAADGAGTPLARGAEALADLLAQREMTQLGVLGLAPLRLLLAAVPALPGAGDARLELAAVVARGRAVLAVEHGTPAPRTEGQDPGAASAPAAGAPDARRPAGVVAPPASSVVPPPAGAAPEVVA